MNQSFMTLDNRHGGGNGGYVLANNRNNKNVSANNLKNKNWKVKKGYNVSPVNESYQHNRLKSRKYISKKKFSYNSNSAPLASRNTISFIIRAKRSGGITSLVSPCSVTPIFSPSREDLVDMAKEEFGVDGYGSMKGLIRVRSPNEEECGLNECVIGNDLSRFEMINPNYGVADNGSCNLVNRVDDQDTRIAKLEEENLVLKERVLFMEREFSKLRTRLQSLEMQRLGAVGSAESVSESRGYENNDLLLEENNVDVGVGEIHMEDNEKSEENGTADIKNN